MDVGEKWLTMYIHIDKHLDHCKARGFSRDTTIPFRRDILERVCRAVGDLHKATAQQLEAWLADDNWSPQTRATYFGHIRGYYRWAQRNGLIAVNPTDLLDRPRVPYQAPRGTSEDAFRHILRNAVEPYLTCAMLAGYAGLRCAEICRVRREDVTGPSFDDLTGQIRVRGKGGRVDEIPTHEEIWRHVRGRTGPLIRDVHGRPYRPNSLSKLFSYYVHHELNLNLSLHKLRHLYADRLRRTRDAEGNAIDIEVIRGLMRHRSLATTQRYLSPRDRERQDAIRALPTVA